MSFYTIYALRLLIYLSAREGRTCSITTIADAYGVSKHHLAQVAHALRKTGLIEADRGRHGGFRLAVPPHEIAIGQTVRVLAHLYPEADVPVVQLSINALKPLDYHLDLAARLAPLRERGIVILGSGNVVHNLGRVQWNRPDAAFDWVERFDDAVVDRLATDPGGILKVAEHPDYGLAVPTPDHFIPLLYLAGLAAAGESAAEPLVRGYAMGSISMTCYGVGVDRGRARNAAGAAVLPPDVPADQTNL